MSHGIDRAHPSRRVSTTDQDPQRQLDERREFAENTDDEPEVLTYADVLSSTETAHGDEYQCLRGGLEDGTLDIVVVHELSRLSRRGADEDHEFLEATMVPGSDAA